MSSYSIASADACSDSYEGSDVPGEFRRLTETLESEQLALTLIRIPRHSDFEQGSGHRHEETEEIYLITKGRLTMRFDDEIEEIAAGSAVRVAAGTTRSHRNLGDEPVEMWAISRKRESGDAIKVEDFWDASPDADQTK